MTSEAVIEHHAEAPNRLRVAVISVSDTRTIETDMSGALIVDLLREAGHEVADRRIVPDEPLRLTPLLQTLRETSTIDAVLMTGGTGISPRDQTYEVVSSLLTKPLPGYGELFRMLSYEEIGPAAMLSRAIGGLMGTTVVLVMPGSRAAVRLAMEKLILPELPHLVQQARKGRPG